MAQLGKLLVIGFDGTTVSGELRSLLTRIQPAGVILFARNIQNGQQTHRLLKDCCALVEEPLFTCVDLEGGRVDRFRDMIGATPAAADVYATANRELFRKHGQIVGKTCRALGFNVDLAPVLDLAREASRKVMGSRSVSPSPGQVIIYAREFVRGLRASGILGAGKHFPGLGEGKLDSHHRLPVIRKPFIRLWEEDLLPYRRLKRELPMILINHANYPLVTRDRLPATVSRKWIGETLRRRIGYRGLILSDDLEMGAVLKTGGPAKAAIEFIRAGGDLCLICHRQEYVEQAFAAMEREYDRDPKFRQKVAEAAGRVSALKRRVRIGRSASSPSTGKIEQLSRRLWEFAEQVRFEKLAEGAASGVEE
ncbi:MAG: beta-N-acetylhexosaminidase [Acidobacteria bacterium]|nr:beta-N-acetylhexosaminidase [Acidobacteriota bacterium]